MMPSLNLFRQASAEADVRSEMSNIGIASAGRGTHRRRRPMAGYRGPVVRGRAGR